MTEKYSFNEMAMINEVEGQGVLFMETDGKEELYYINDVCMDIIKLLQEKSLLFDELLDSMGQIYEVSKDVLGPDLQDVLDELMSLNIVEKN